MKITQRLKEKSSDLQGSAPVVIGFLGDSVTHGCFEIYHKHGGGIETEFRSVEAYHQKLKLMLETVLPSVVINTIDAGISGDCARRGAERVERDIIAFKPDLCVVCYGLNDCGEREKGLEMYGESLASIFKQLKDAGIETIFMTPNMIGEYATPEILDKTVFDVLDSISKQQTDGIMDMYMDKAREVCKANGVTVCDCYAKWKKLKENGADITRLLANRINHPNEKMHWMFAQSLFDMIMDF